MIAGYSRASYDYLFCGAGNPTPDLCILGKRSLLEPPLAPLDCNTFSESPIIHFQIFDDVVGCWQGTLQTSRQFLFSDTLYEGMVYRRKSASLHSIRHQHNSPLCLWYHSLSSASVFQTTSCREVILCSEYWRKWQSFPTFPFLFFFSFSVFLFETGFVCIAPTVLEFAL